LNQGTDWAGKTLGAQRILTIGVALNPVGPTISTTKSSAFHAKVEAGAHYANDRRSSTRALARFSEKLGGKPAIPV